MTGSTKEDDAVFKALLERDPECKKCFECGYPYPQWCSYTHGIMTCLECSGKHRGLGTHLVCVRSSTMDGWSNWKPEKLRQMEIGGNRRAREFFDAHGVPKAPLKARYEHAAAQMYRAKLEAEALGEVFNEASFKAVDYSAPPPNHSRSPATPGQGNQNRFQGVGSQGSANPKAEESEWLSALSSGWSTVTAKATAAASTAVTAVESTAAKVTSNEFKENVAKNATEVGATVTQTASKAWGAMSYFASTLATSVKKTVAGEGGVEDDGLGGLTRNVARSTQQFDHVEHRVESPVTPAEGDGLRDLTSHLKRDGGRTKYEGIGSEAPTSAPPPPQARRTSPVQQQAPPPPPPAATSTSSASPNSASKTNANDGWDADW
jgi:ADP-ribosylation factor GTPase-activating protein 1